MTIGDVESRAVAANALRADLPDGWRVIAPAGSDDIECHPPGGGGYARVSCARGRWAGDGDALADVMVRYVDPVSGLARSDGRIVFRRLPADATDVLAGAAGYVIGAC